MNEILSEDIQYLAGVGPQRAQMLQKEIGIFTIGDLLQYYPYRYIDRTKYYKVNEIRGDMPYVQIIGQFTGLKKMGDPRKERLVAQFSDNTGTIECVWFKGVKWVSENLKANTNFVLFGKPNIFNQSYNIVHPEFEELAKYQSQTHSSLSAMYNTTEKMKKAGLHSKAIQKIMRSVIDRVKKSVITETLPSHVLQKCRMPILKETIVNIHFPENADSLRKAQFRIKFEELFYVQLNMLQRKLAIQKSVRGNVFSEIGTFFNTFYNEKLPFELTGAQKRVLKEIRKDVGSSKQMNRLLQGDVGSGKTLVALMSMFMGLDNGFQACLMAPTEILATQHFQTIVEMLNGMEVNVRLLTGSTRKAQRTIIHDELLKGTLHILVGTHALLEDEVKFKNLGICIIDEQHRFGVAQRARLWKKNIVPPHVLVMTATPIPRTLSMTIYGDLDISVIDELPPGRKPIKTAHYFDNKRSRLFGFMKEQIKQGRQIYVVYPLISESEKMDYKDLEDGYEAISRVFPPPEYQVAVVHGKMKAADKDKSMKMFADGKAQIMVATTVIEVGVNVPNATVMVIESAERFGLSQLHQLRGRVGRGGDQSYCILMTSYKLSDDSRKRIQTMVATNDGFEIAEVDLRLRGPGDLDGTQQSGLAINFKLANLAKDTPILKLSRDIASAILEEDPNLQKEENYILQKQMKRQYARTINWSKIS